jgi:hypothetical protein
MPGAGDSRGAHIRTTHPQSSVQAHQVCTDRRQPHTQLGGHLRVASPRRQGTQHIPLSGGKRAAIARKR